MSNDSKKDHDYMGEIVKWKWSWYKRDKWREESPLGKLMLNEVSIAVGRDGKFMGWIRNNRGSWKGGYDS